MDDLAKIRKNYGEKMMHLCRKLFPTLLEKKELWTILESSFQPSKFLYDDIMNNDLELEFKDYIMSLSKPVISKTNVDKKPNELLNQLNYTLYECKTEEEIQSFKKYYFKGEELCTFNGNRLNECFVFFAVKKNINEIIRENYKNPKRQDEYGTSIISIQFTKGKTNTLSIKNRYNATVSNPDATYSNNLDNIIPGLTNSFQKAYNLNINQNVGNGIEIPGYVKTPEGKYYKYNYQINNIYYCPDNIIIDNFKVKKFEETERYIILDYFILDLKDKKIELYDKNINDSFVDNLKDIKKIDVIKNQDSKIINITFNNDTKAYIEIDKTNRIKSYKNENIKEIKDNFLYYNEILQKINISSTIKIGNNFLYNNKMLTELYLPLVTNIEDNFLLTNNKIEALNINEVTNIGANFLSKNNKITFLSIPKTKIIGNNFMYNNKVLNKLIDGELTSIGNNFLLHNDELTEINFSKIITIGDNFIFWNEKINNINIPKVKVIGDCFLNYNNKLKKLFMPEVIQIKEDFLYYNEILEQLYAPNLEQIGDLFLYNNFMLNQIDISNVKIIGEKCLYHNDELEEINTPLVTIVGNDFLYNNPMKRKRC